MEGQNIEQLKEIIKKRNAIQEAWGMVEEEEHDKKGEAIMLLQKVIEILNDL